MDLLTLLPYLEPYERTVVATKTAIGEALSYTGMTGVTINSEDSYTNVNQVCLLANGSDLYLYVNHTTRRARAKYKITNISSILIT